MSTITDAEILTRLSLLPDKAKAEVVEYIDKRIETETPPKKLHNAGWGKDLIVRYLEDSDSLTETVYREPGWAKGLIFMSDDFDEPMEDFREYME